MTMSVKHEEKSKALPQGDVRLLRSDVAQRLLASSELARLAYTALDGTPRVLPMLFHWTGEELVMAAFRPTHKIPALRARPDVAVTIDSNSTSPQVLLIRGRAVIVDVNGLVPEYVLAQRRYWGAAHAEAYLSQLDPESTKMARIAVRPTWVGVLDFQTRFPEKTPAALRG
jgi:hypothetical protein